MLDSSQSLPAPPFPDCRSLQQRLTIWGSNDKGGKRLAQVYFNAGHNNVIDIVEGLHGLCTCVVYTEIYVVQMVSQLESSLGLHHIFVVSTVTLHPFEHPSLFILISRPLTPSHSVSIQLYSRHKFMCLECHVQLVHALVSFPILAVLHFWHNTVGYIVLYLVFSISH